MPDNFLGAGMKFPPQIDKATGRFVVSSDKQSVKESVYLILMTQVTERFLRPEFGSNLMSYTFMDISDTAISMMVRTLTNQLMSQEPRLESVDITTDSEIKDGCLLVNIGYTIRDTKETDNLVVPLYMNESGEEEAYEPQDYEDYE